MTRRAGIHDLPAIVNMKVLMFDELGMADLLLDGANDRVLGVYKVLYEEGKAQHFVVEEDGEIVACSGAFLKDDIPYCFFGKPFYGFIGDVYTYPEYRRRGHARQLTVEAINWLKEQGVEKVRLLAISSVRPLYEELGFQPTDEMVLFL